jgi:hypothetical protein
MLHEFLPAMSTTIIENFPAHRLDEARSALEKAHARIIRAAAKTGQIAPAGPELIVLAQRSESRCHDCKTAIEGFPPEFHLCRGTPVNTGTDGAWTSRHLVDLELIAARPVLAGWDFLAVIEPLEGGNLLRQVPGAAVAEGELAPWRQGKISCNHCGTSRRRTETFVVRADGSDPAVAAGTYRQVGRNCLGAFLGGKSPASIVAQLAWPDVVRTAGDDGEGGWGGGGGASVFQPEVFLAQVAACIRLDGWVSRSQARAAADDFGTGRHVQPTADQVCALLTPPYGGDRRGDWRRECERCRPIAGDIELGGAALAWARALPPTSDYERNLVLVAQQTGVQPAHAGILASAVPAYMRELGREIERRREAEGRTLTPSQHIGQVGERLELELTVQRVHTTDSDYGAVHIISMRDEANNLVVWMTGSRTATPGDRLRVRGTVKKHNEYRGEAQTLLTRCSAAPVEFDHPLWPPPMIKRARRGKKAAPRLDDVLGEDSCPLHAPIAAVGADDTL